MKPHLLEISYLDAYCRERQILFDVSCVFEKRKIVVLMGPNGSGKSTLAHVILGEPIFHIREGVSKKKKGNDTYLVYNGKDISRLPTEERAQKGIFLSFQTPVAVPGVSVTDLLRAAYEEKTVHKKPSYTECMSRISTNAKLLHIDPALLQREIHEGFSGGERKKIELLQAMVLRPSLAIFDEIDTGVDSDALKLIAKGLRTLQSYGAGMILITHNERILEYVDVDRVYVMKAGRIVKEGGVGIIREIRKSGYKKYS